MFQNQNNQLLQPMWITTVALLLVTLNCELRKCWWSQSNDQANWVSYYLNYPVSGNCHYALYKTKQNGINRTQLMLFINDLSLNNKSQLPISCIFDERQETIDCTTKIFSLFMQKQQSKLFNVTLKSQKTTQNKSKNSLNLQFWQYVYKKQFQSKSDFSKLTLETLKLQNIYLQDNQQKLSENDIKMYQLIYKLIRLAFPSILMYYICKDKYSILAYVFLQKIILFQMIQNCILSINQQLKTITFGKNNTIYNFFSICSLVVYFAFIMLCFKNVVIFLQNGVIKFSNQSKTTNPNNQVQNNQIYNLSVNTQTYKQQRKFLLIFKIINFYINRFIQKINNQHHCIKRILLLVFVLGFQILVGFCSQIVQIGTETVLLIILPSYTLLRKINCSSQLSFDIFKMHSMDDMPSIKKALSPLSRINIYFILNLFILSKRYGVVSLFSLRAVFQVSFIVLLWLGILQLIEYITSSKNGMKIKIYRNNAKTSQNYGSKIFKFLTWVRLKLNTKQNQANNLDKTEQLSCCICLQILQAQTKAQSFQNICIQTQCGHIFHSKCFSQWVKNKMMCPVDRNVLNQEIVNKVIDNINVPK